MYLIMAATLAVVLIWANGLLGSAFAVANDPLPHWNDGKVKQDIIEFVARVTDPDVVQYLADLKK